MVDWLGYDPAAPEELTAHERKYRGALRAPLSEDWTQRLGDPGHWALARLELSSPVVNGGSVLVGNSRDVGLLVLDRTTGVVQRVVGTDGPVQAAPTRIEGGWLLADTFGVVQRFDDGWEPVWQEAYRAGGAIYRPVVVDGDQVLLATGSDEVVSLDLASGAWRWTARRDVPRGSQELAIQGAPTPTVVGDLVLAGYSDGAVLGLDRETGRELWALRVGAGGFPDIQSEVLDLGDVWVAAAFGGPMVGIDPRDHSVRWQNDEAGATSSMVEAGGLVYAADARGRVIAVDAETGELEWESSWRDAQFGPPTRAGGLILVGNVAGTLHGLDRFDGKERWRYRPMNGSSLSGVAAAPAVDGRQVVFPSTGGTVHSLIGDPSFMSDPSEEPAQRSDRSLAW